VPYEAGRGKESAYPLVYFVIINWNQTKLTSECLVPLHRQDYPNFRVVIVDNGSNDDSIQVLIMDFPWVSFIEAGENLGYSGGNNLGIEFALNQCADYIFLLNNDTEVNPRMLGKPMEVAGKNERTGMVGPTMYYAEPPDKICGTVNRIAPCHLCC
jgi:GT2 family glycosyltransferase